MGKHCPFSAISQSIYSSYKIFPRRRPKTQTALQITLTFWYFLTAEQFVTVLHNKNANNFHFCNLQVTVNKVEKELSFVIHTCFVSSSSNVDASTVHKIIENICPTDESVKFYKVKNTNDPTRREQTEKKRFSFMFKSVFNTSLVFLHCELTLCTKRDGAVKGLPKVSARPFIPFVIFSKDLGSLVNVRPSQVSYQLARQM